MDDRFKWADFTGEDAPSACSEPGCAGQTERLRKMLHRLFEASPVGLFSLDNVTGRFLRVNREFERITGYSRDDLLSLSFTRLVAPEDVERVSEYRRRRMRGDTTLPSRYEMLILTRHGDRKVVLFHATPLPFTDVISGAIIDITAEKVRVDPMLHVQRMDSLASLASGLAGEFNNLLASITGYAELALSRLGHVRNLLAFARSGTNALGSVEVRSVIENVLNVLPRTAMRSTRPAISIGPRLGSVRGDATQIEQALLNVLINAAEAQLPESRPVEVTAEVIGANELPDFSDFHGGEVVRIIVQDHGAGIPLEDQVRVFQPFFTTKESTRHPGLGLSTAYGILHDHGGTIELESTPGGGTCVTLCLPREKDPELLVPAPIDEQTEERVFDAVALIVDDEEFVGELLRDVLEDVGIEVHCETSAREALQGIQDKRYEPDLVIVDLRMPDLDGRSFIRMARSDGFQAPIIVTSGFSAPEEGDQALRELTQGFLCKPFAKAELLREVRRALHPQDAEQQPPSPVEAD